MCTSVFCSIDPKLAKQTNMHTMLLRVCHWYQVWSKGPMVWECYGVVTSNQNKQGVCHIVALSFTLKCILRQKKNYGNSNISPCKNIIFKKSSKINQNPSRYYNSITNLQVSTQAKISSFKNPHVKIDLLLLPRGQNPLSYYTL